VCKRKESVMGRKESANNKYRTATGRRERTAIWIGEREKTIV